MSRLRLFAVAVLLAFACPASADIRGPFRPNQPSEDVPHAPPRPQPQPRTCGTGAGLSLAGIAAVWGLTWGSTRLRRMAKFVNPPIRR